MKKWLSFIILFVFSQCLWAQTGHIAGKVRDRESGKALVGANLVIKSLKRGAGSDENGEFILKDVPAGQHLLSVTYLGYVAAEINIEVSENATSQLLIELKPTALLGREVTVVGTRAIEGETPAAFSTLEKADIETRYYAQDIPVLLSEMPSTTFYSENGNGIGYNYITLRGFDQRRISVMINGIPQNDPEDHNVYWLDFPDFLENVEDIQVQRGAGSAFYGPPAIGGSVNIVTAGFSPERRITAYTGVGTYNTQKFALAANTGLLNDKFVLSGRVSQIKSDGYRHRSSVDFKSYFVGAAMFGKRSSLRLHFYGGPIEDQLAFFGISKELTENRETRKTNPLEGDKNIENFNQPHLELIHEYQFNERLTLYNTLFGIRGYGFFDFDGSWAPMSYYRLTPEFGFDIASDPEETFVDELLVRAYVDNKQVGWLPNLTWKGQRYDLVIGGEFRFHRSLHWGRIQEGSNDLPPAVSGEYRGLNYVGERRYYEYKGGKDIISPYVNLGYRFNQRLNGMLGLQFVNQRYSLFDEKFVGTDFDVDYHFLNPRLGLNYYLNPDLRVFASYARTSREPRLKNLYDAAESSTPESWGAVVPQFEITPDGSYNFDEPLVRPETLDDIEIGLGYQGGIVYGNLNLFYMNFRNEIVKSGQVDRFGQPVTGNAERTRHTGIELSGGIHFFSRFSFTGNLTYSNNELQRYTIFDFDDQGNLSEVRLDGNPIAGFPDFLANARLAYHHAGLTASLTMQHVGKQYTDNFKNEANTVDSFTVFHGMAGYDLGKWFNISGLILQLHVQNIFDTLYNMSGEGDTFFPAAERQIFVNAKFEL